MHLLIDFFQRLYHFDDLIRWGGHGVLILIIFSETGVMAGFFLPGDSLLVTAGVLAAAGVLNIWVLLIELSAAAVLGDSVNYAVGRRIGPAIFTREDSLFFNRGHLLRAHAFYEKYGSKTIVIARFIPIVRTFAPVVAGVGEMDYSKFIFYNLLGGIGWVVLMLMGGYSLGRYIPHMDKHLHEVILLVIILSLLPPIFEWLKERRRAGRGGKPA